MPSEPALISVQVCAAWPDRVLQQTLRLKPGTCLQELRTHPDLDPALAQAWQEAAEVGIFGQRCKGSQPLQHGDRVELWRALLADPKEARRARVTAARQARLRARAQARQAVSHESPSV